MSTAAQPSAVSTAPGLKVKQSAGAPQDQRVVQSAETLPDLPNVNVAEGVRRMGDNVPCYCAILEKFYRGRQNTLAEIRSAIAENDWESAELLAHTLKGLLGTIGADKLMFKCAELKLAIKGWNGKQIESLRSRDRVELLLSAIDPELAQLSADIDRALQLRAAEENAGAEVADTAGSVDMKKLAGLIRQVKLQLEQYDSRVEDNVALIRQLVFGDDAMKQALAPIEMRVSGYDYEQALAELTACARSMGVSCE
jgi:polar amino acid transport system substrate-binding protein